jgi:hypothetical protein
MATASIDADLFRELEEGLWRQETRSDREWLDGVLSSDFVEFCRFGHAYDREHILNAPVRDIEVEFPFTDFNVEELAPGVVTVTYLNTVRYQGRTQSARRSSVWVDGDGGWKLKFQQATTAAE